MKSGLFAIAGATAGLAFAHAAASAASLPVNISGYELFAGVPCTTHGQSGTCDVEFSGWTGGNGPRAGGWTRFPGTRQGLWRAGVNYVGRPQFGGQVTVEGGNIDLLFTDGTVVSGNVTAGMVEWPEEGQATVCGTDVGAVSLSIAFTHGAAGSGSFHGCLHDLPAGAVIPPKVWGRFQTGP